MEISSNMCGFSTSLQGINKAQNMLNKSAQNIANGQADLAKETVSQIAAEKSQAANVNAIKTREEMLDELMNMR